MCVCVSVCPFPPGAVRVRALAALRCLPGSLPRDQQAVRAPDRACGARRVDATLLSCHGTRGLVLWSGLTPGSQSAIFFLVYGAILWCFAMPRLYPGSDLPTECGRGPVSSSKRVQCSTIVSSEAFSVPFLPGSAIFPVQKGLVH